MPRRLVAPGPVVPRHNRFPDEPARPSRPAPSSKPSDVMIPSGDPGIQLFIRNKHPRLVSRSSPLIGS